MNFDQWQAWLLVVVASLNVSIANILIKTSRLREHDAGIAGLLFSPWFIAGAGFFGISLLLSSKALETLPVSLVYPVQAGCAFVFLMMMSVTILHEPLAASRLFGIGLILFGIVLTAR